MGMQFEELDDTTRRYMLEEFEAEQAGANPYVSTDLSAAGRAAFLDLMRQAITDGDEDTLTAALSQASLWNPTQTYERKGVVRQRQINVAQAAERLARNEFNTWYVRGFAKRLMDEGVTTCQVYRAATPKWEPADCTNHEGQIVPVDQVLRGHRALYWPEPGDPSVFSIPFQPGCHHTIRRVS